MPATIEKTSQAEALVNKQRAFFRTGQTKDVSFRLKYLKSFKEAVKNHEGDINEALKRDFQKPTFETYVSEIGIVFEEIDYISKRLSLWAQPEKVDTPITIHPGSSYIYNVPYGVSLIIGAWNYPFQLTLAPLVGALAAGNCAILKPSELAEHTSRIITQIVKEVFPEEYVAVVEGGVEETQDLLAQKFDYIFFTGSERVGKIVAQAAAKHLTPTTLELGGKSPCIVTEDADIDMAARRIVWGKFLNGGQTCVAPDYILAEDSIKTDLIFKMKKYVREFYGDNPKESPDYPRVINERHFDRLVEFLEDGEVAIGGEHDRVERYIAPTILDNVSWDSSIMQDEIFGPIMPVLSYQNLEEVVEMINDRPSPLAFYIFTEKKSVSESLINAIEFGGGCVNDTVTHFANPNLPFGGVGSSGSGAYHGKFSFDTFSHRKGIHKKTTWIDVPLRYAPYENKVTLLKTVIN